MANFWFNFRRQVRKQDIFGIPVQLTYKGDTTFNTFCGGCISILFVLTFLTVFSLRLYECWRYPNF